MNLPLNEVIKAKELISKSTSVLIISHKSPDGDTIGANSALRLALFSLGKRVASACIDPIPPSYDFFSGFSSFLREINLSDYDLIISVDVGASYLLKFQENHPELLDKEKVNLINIDHHPSNDNFGKVNIVIDTAAATCLVIYFFLKELGIEITKEIATSLLAGIYYDTGSFMHSNITDEVYEVAGILQAKGADFKIIVRKLFHFTPINQMRLWGRILNRARMNKKNIVASAVTKADLEELGVNSKDVSGVIDYLNAVPNSKFCILLTEDNNGQVKASLRTQRDDVDLSKLTADFGGGGHKKAAGFTIPGKLEQEVVWRISAP